jgi:hypothetical protein
MTDTLQIGVRGAYRALTGMSPVELAAKLTLLTLLLSPVGEWAIRPFVLTLAVAGLLLPRLWRSATLWLLLAGLTAVRFWLDWPLADNHAYLLSYWCLAMGLAAWKQDPRMLALSARLLIGLMFALAAWQKWTSPDFVNGVFFQTTFLLDDRFEDFVLLFTSVTYEQIDLARDYLEGDYRTAAPGEGLPFVLPMSFSIMVWLSTAWNLFEQTLIAVTFLAPTNSRLGRLRDVALLLFCYTIYAVVPVVSFGWLLLAMGVSQSRPSAGLRVAYLGAFVMLVFYVEVPWAGLLTKVLGA